MKKALIGFTLLLGAAVSAQNAVNLSNVSLQQNPQTQVVEVGYTLSGGDPLAVYYVTFGIQTNGVPLPDTVFSTVLGDVTTAQNPRTFEADGNPKKIYWAAKQDWRGNVTANARAVVNVWPTNTPPSVLIEISTAPYVVVDLSGGPSAASYPVWFSDTAPDMSGPAPACKTTQLWLRRIPAGTFTMGTPDATQLPPDGELGRNSTREYQHPVTLTQDFYIGVFEVTQRQWERVMGTDPSSSTSGKGDTWPVNSITYNTIRGATSDIPHVNWPWTGRLVSPASFMGVIRAKTGLLFDLPTEAQWEYACRAGTTGAWNNGTTITNVNVDANLGLLGRYNSSSAVAVGTYLPNAWGLYDMHGNIVEWCLDWTTGNLGTVAVDNPEGAQSSTERIIRGGAYGSLASSCRSGWRSSTYAPNSSAANRGFRACIQPPIIP